MSSSALIKKQCPYRVYIHVSRETLKLRVPAVTITFNVLCKSESSVIMAFFMPMKIANVASLTSSMSAQVTVIFLLSSPMELSFISVIHRNGVLLGFTVTLKAKQKKLKRISDENIRALCHKEIILWNGSSSEVNTGRFT